MELVESLLQVGVIAVTWADLDQAGGRLDPVTVGGNVAEIWVGKARGGSDQYCRYTVGGGLLGVSSNLNLVLKP